MGIQESLLAAGYTPAGVNPGTDTLSRINSALGTYQSEVRAKRERQQKDNQRKMDMYKTLRDTGYDPAAAYDAAMKDQLPGAPGGIGVEQEKKEAEVKNIQASTDLKKATTVKTLKMTDSQKTLTSNILAKIADDEPLTAGEQKVYDEVIRKYGNKSNLEEALSGDGTDAAAAPIKMQEDTATYVPMTDPTGKPKKVHKDDVQKAMAAGWKKR